MRYLGEAIGANVAWSGSLGVQTVTLARITSPNVNFTVMMAIGSKELTCQGSGIQGDSLTMDVAPLLKDGRAFPARYVAEAFGYTVAWDPIDRTVTIA